MRRNFSQGLGNVGRSIGRDVATGLAGEYLGGVGTRAGAGTNGEGMVSSIWMWIAIGLGILLCCCLCSLIGAYAAGWFSCEPFNDEAGQLPVDIDTPKSNTCQINSPNAWKLFYNLI